jgi:DNA-binding transcriptional LysR family regulator
VARTYVKEGKLAHEEVFAHRALTSHMETLAILIRSGRYLGYLPVHFAQSFVEEGEMRSLLDAELAYFDTFYLACRKDERNRATALLSKCLAETLAAPR